MKRQRQSLQRKRAAGGKDYKTSMAKGADPIRAAPIREIIFSFILRSFPALFPRFLNLYIRDGQRERGHRHHCF
jgi:hypothetical protein